MLRMLRLSVAAIAMAAAGPLAAQTLTITTAGGEYGAAMKQAMWEPAATELGLDVREETQSDGFAALKMQVTSGA
ncbi:MAG: ABC transporter substrate-binding protein, partial [Pararhizobium sp.]